ncbi:MAG: EscU/YscU/HrcU family type III secretion system export apparatus switch protein [Nitrospirae bacterium]|nr:EscU/YscU/HrcU family type III secretion system export apparatus switch protein [Nitrospirota bacterium]
MADSPGRREPEEERVELSIALRYLPGIDEAPLVLVNGQGEIARAIVRLARTLRIPVVREEALSQKLLRVPPGHPIPHELYEAVAVILAVLYSEKAGPPGD